jgi:hypothetical protein
MGAGEFNLLMSAAAVAGSAATQQAAAVTPRCVCSCYLQNAANGTAAGEEAHDEHEHDHEDSEEVSYPCLQRLLRRGCYRVPTSLYCLQLQAGPQQSRLLNALGSACSCMLACMTILHAPNAL